MILVPRHHFEAASSIERDVYLDRRSVLRAGEAMRPGLAFGSAQGPLDILALETQYVYGSGNDLLMQRTLYPYQALGLVADSATRLERKMLTGRGRAPQSQLAVWARMQRGGVRVCRMCEWVIWREFGVAAFLWPHLAPFMEACPWHGCLLVERCPLVTAPVRRPKGTAAHSDQIALSRALLSLHAVHDKVCLTSAYRHALEASGFVHSDGRYRAADFSAAFAEFVSGLDVHSALRRIAAFPKRGREILSWMAGGGTLNPAIILLFSMFVQHLASCDGAWFSTRCIEPVPETADRHEVSPRAWRAKKRRPSPADVRTPHALAETALLIAQGCTCADVARLCRTSPRAVYRYVRCHGLRGAIENAKRDRLSAEARAAWLRRVRQFPQASANRLAKLEPRAYRWLYRHDHAWLREHWPTSPARRQCKRADATAPHGQDAALCARIRAARNALLRDSLNHRPSLAALCRQLGMTEYGLHQARRWRRVDKEVRQYLLSR